MRRDWKAISSVLDVIEQLAGHPNLKELRDEANEDLKDLLAKPPQTWVPETPKPEPVTEPEPETKDDNHPEFNPDGTVKPKISRRSL